MTDVKGPTRGAVAVPQATKTDPLEKYEDEVLATLRSVLPNLVGPGEGGDKATIAINEAAAHSLVAKLPQLAANPAQFIRDGIIGAPNVTFRVETAGAKVLAAALGTWSKTDTTRLPEATAAIADLTSMFAGHTNDQTQIQGAFDRGSIYTWDPLTVTKPRPPDSSPITPSTYNQQQHGLQGFLEAFNPDAVAAAPSAPGKLGPTIAAPTSSIQTALSSVPLSVDDNYRFALSPDAETLSINPRRSQAPVTRSISVSDNAQGGKDVVLDDRPYRGGEWVTASLRDLVKNPGQISDLTMAGYGTDSLNKQRDLLVVTGKSGDPIIFAFSGDPARPGFVAICQEVSIVDMDGKPGQAVVRKPVVYLYPEQMTNVSLQLRISGPFTAQYPPSKNGVWSFRAGPDGVLFDPETERRYSYVFWEGLNPRSFELNPAQAHLINRSEALGFLEKVSARFALNDRERTDFISYWLPSLERNERSLVQLLDEQTYEQYAAMTVTPTPAIMIRLFMIFQRAERQVTAGNPEIPARLRKGFTVVEWGGCDLDEGSTSR
jgi:hypothetical protein